MDLRAWLAFYVGMVAILMGGALAALFGAKPDAAIWMAAVAAVAAVVQTVVAGVMMRGLQHARTQADAAQESVAIIERTAERQLRAYVHVTQSTLDIGAAGEGAKITLVIKNVGQTPAHNVVFTYAAMLVPPPVLGHMTLPDDALVGSETTLGAGCEDSTVLAISSANWDHHVSRLTAGTLVQVVIARVQYRDVFDRQRETGFAVHYVWDGTNELVAGSDHGRNSGNYAT